MDAYVSTSSRGNTGPLAPLKSARVSTVFRYDGKYNRVVYEYLASFERQLEKQEASYNLGRTSKLPYIKLTFSR